MVSYQYSYLIGAMSTLIIWFVLFFWRKDTRKEMLIISIIYGVIGIIVDPIYAIDWWFPLTITNTMPGIESFIFGFAIAGIASVIYIHIFNKKIKIKKANKKQKLKRNLNYIFIVLLSLGIFLVDFFILKLNSFYASFPAIIIPLAIILIKRKDLILNSLFSGIFLTIISFIFYFIPELITPGWISSAWNFEMISKITILKIPIEDVIWYFLTGAFIGPLYEYWQEGKLINKE